MASWIPRFKTEFQCLTSGILREKTIEWLPLWQDIFMKTDWEGSSSGRNSIEAAMKSMAKVSIPTALRR